MDLEEIRCEGKKLFTDGITVGEWFSKIEAIFGCYKPHIVSAIAPFPYVALSQHTMSLYGPEIMLSLETKIIEGACVVTNDRYFFFTESVDAEVFKLIWFPSKH